MEQIKRITNQIIMWLPKDTTLNDAQKYVDKYGGDLEFESDGTPYIVLFEVMRDG